MTSAINEVYVRRFLQILYLVGRLSRFREEDGNLLRGKSNWVDLFMKKNDTAAVNNVKMSS